MVLDRFPRTGDRALVTSDDLDVVTYEVDADQDNLRCKDLIIGGFGDDTGQGMGHTICMQRI